MVTAAGPPGATMGYALSGHKQESNHARIAGGHLRGVLCMLIAVAAFCLMDASMKMLAPHYPPMQMAALRGVTSLPLVLVWTLVDGGLAQLLRVRWPLHVLRGVLSVVMLVAFVYGLERLPLAEAYSLFFVAPLLDHRARSADPRRESRLATLGGNRGGPRRNGDRAAADRRGHVFARRPGGDRVGRVLCGVGDHRSHAGPHRYHAEHGRLDARDAERVLACVRVAEWMPIDPAHWKPIAVLGAGRRDRTVGHHRSVSSRAGFAGGATGIYGAGLGPRPRLVAVGHAAGSDDGGAAVIVVCGLYLLRGERVHVEAEHP